MFSFDFSSAMTQAEALAHRSADGGEPLFVPLTVTLELEWVLLSGNEFTKEATLTTLVRLLETRELEFQDEPSVEWALFYYRSLNVDFAACLHLGCAISYGRLPFITFDR